MRIFLESSRYLILLVNIFTYGIFIFGSDGDFLEYLLTSNIINFFLLLLLFLNLKMDKIIKRNSLLSFPFNPIQIIIKRLQYLAKDILIVVFLLSTFSLLFKSDIELSNRILFFVCLLFQQIFTICFFMTFWDFLVLKGFEKHINLIVPIVSIVLIFSRGTEFENIVYLANPVGGIVNFPLFLLHENNGSYVGLLVIPLLFLFIYFLNRILLRNWI